MKEHPIRAAAISLALGLAYSVAMIAEGPSTARAGEGLTTYSGDAVTIYRAGVVTYFAGTLDTFSTHGRRVDMHAADRASAAGKTGAVALDGGYSVAIFAPGGEGFAAESCDLLGADVVSGATHVYMRCP